MGTAAQQLQLTALYWHFLNLGPGNQNGTVALHRVKKHRKQAFSRNRTIHSAFELNMLVALRFITSAISCQLEIILVRLLNEKTH